MSTVAHSTVTPQLSRTLLIYGLIAFLASLSIYCFTLAPTVTLVDSGELIVAAKSLGVAHPPGFPLYVMLAHLATLIPIGSIAVRVNFASAVFAASAATMCALVLMEAMITPRSVPQIKSEKSGGRGKKTKKSFTPSEKGTSQVSSIAIVASSLVAGLL